MMNELPELTDEERARYEWQSWTPDIGEEGQRKLKAARVLVSRIGGVGGTVAYYLTAAGVGKLVLAHGGNIKPSDLNRQLLMTTDRLGTPRSESAPTRLHDLNPNVEVVTVMENISESNVDELVSQVDMVVDAAPLFPERFAMNRACVQQEKPLVEAAMYDFSATLTTILPGKTPCLKCLVDDCPQDWKREFPVFGAVAGSIACLAAVEVIKLVTGVGEPLAGKMLLADLRQMDFQKVALRRRAGCPVCSSLFASRNA